MQKREKIVDLIQSVQLDREVTVMGWIRSFRNDRFIALNDGSTIKTLQVVIDQENEDGLFGVYKRVIQRVSDMVTALNPNYAYPHMLITTVVEGAHQMRFFADHLPTITDQVADEAHLVESFYRDLIQKAITR